MCTILYLTSLFVHIKSRIHYPCSFTVLSWLGSDQFYPYPSGLLHCHWGNHVIAPVPVKQPWRIWVHISPECIIHLPHGQNATKYNTHHVHILWDILHLFMNSSTIDKAMPYWMEPKLLQRLQIEQTMQNQITIYSIIQSVKQNRQNTVQIPPGDHLNINI